MTNGTRLTVGEMRARDWSLLSKSLPVPIFPSEPRFDEFQWALRWFAGVQGFIKRDGLPSPEGNKHLRRIWSGLSSGPYRAGVFTVERAGRWEIAFVLDPEYAEERKIRRVRRRRFTGLDAAFEADFDRRRADAFRKSAWIYQGGSRVSVVIIKSGGAHPKGHL
jgi:hypothetical protein